MSDATIVAISRSTCRRAGTLALLVAASVIREPRSPSTELPPQHQILFDQYANISRSCRSQLVTVRTNSVGARDAIRRCRPRGTHKRDVRPSGAPTSGAVSTNILHPPARVVAMWTGRQTASCRLFLAELKGVCPPADDSLHAEHGPPAAAV